MNKLYGIAILLSIGLLFSNCQSSDYELYSEAQITANFSLDKEIYQVDEIIQATISSSHTDCELSLLIESSYGLSIIPIFVEYNDFTVLIDKKHTYKSGQISISLLGKLVNQSEAKIIEIESKQPIGIMETYLGPKSIRVGGEEKAMLVAIPIDLNGNLINNETVDYNLTTAQQKNKKMTLALRNGVTGLELYSPNKTGLAAIGATCLSSNSIEENLLFINSNPDVFTNDIAVEHSKADGRSLSEVDINQLKDRYGNQISDGTLVNFEFMKGNQINSVFHAVLVDGKANMLFPHPSAKDKYSINISAGPLVKMNSAFISFEQDLLELPVSYNKELQSIEIGKLITTSGNIIANGSRIILELESNNKVIHKVIYAESGFAKFDLGNYLFDSGRYSIKVHCGGLVQKLVISYER